MERTCPRCGCYCVFPFISLVPSLDRAWATPPDSPPPSSQGMQHHPCGAPAVAPTLPPPLDTRAPSKAVLHSAQPSSSVDVTNPLMFAGACGACWVAFSLTARRLGTCLHAKREEVGLLVAVLEEERKGEMALCLRRCNASRSDAHHSPGSGYSPSSVGSSAWASPASSGACAHCP